MEIIENNSLLKLRKMKSQSNTTTIESLIHNDNEAEIRICNAKMWTDDI